MARLSPDMADRAANERGWFDFAVDGRRARVLGAPGAGSGGEAVCRRTSRVTSPGSPDAVHGVNTSFGSTQSHQRTNKR